MCEMESKVSNNSVIIEPIVNRNLLNPNFDCYRVSIEPMVTYCERVDSCVNELRPTDDEYSYLHMSMASHFNHLFSDPYSSQTVFFATTDGQIVCVSIELISGKLTKPKTVYTIPDFDSALISISFPNNELSLIANSNRTDPKIYLMSTPSRSATEPWVLLSTIGLSDYKIENTFHLFCSQTTDLLNSCSQIDFILYFVDKKPQNINDLNQNSTQSSFISVLNWFTITGNANECNSWTVKRTRKLIGTDWPKYVSFDFIGSPLLCVVSDKDFTFVEDSDKPLVETLESDSKPESDHKLIYTYWQTLEDISVTFKLPPHICKTDISIDLNQKNISIKIKNLIEFEGQLFAPIDSNTSVWTLQTEREFQILEITVNKAENGLVWKQFITGDTNGVEIVNNEMIDEIRNKLTHLTNDMPDRETDQFEDKAYTSLGLEECDFTENSLVFNRYNGNTHSISHRIDLSGNQWLFAIPVHKSVDSDCNELPYFVVRHDVDALVWWPRSSPDINQFTVTHVSTFAAFGYVQASKTKTRYIAAGNDFGFVAIADGLRHVYVYRQSIHIQSGEVRNRKTGQELQTIANQHVINLSDCQSIIGFITTNDSIFVLSNDKIFLIKL